jgi:hypothetical protein
MDGLLGSTARRAAAHCGGKLGSSFVSEPMEAELEADQITAARPFRRKPLK